MEASSAATNMVHARHAHPLSTLTRVLVRDAPVLCVIAVYVGSAYLLKAFAGLPEHIAVGLGSWYLLASWTAAYCLVGLIVTVGYGLIREQRSVRNRESWRLAISRFFDRRMLLGFLLVFLVLPPFMTVFLGFKAAIPAVNPFAWDYSFMELDRWLHAGRDPWVALQPVLGHPTVTNFLDRVYYTWFPVIWLTLIWQLWHGDHFSKDRTRFLLSFVLCWILLGSVAATFFSSVGPAYYGHVVDGPNQFVPLMDYLKSVDETHTLTALWAQDVLWQGYIDPNAAQIEGISAMPSMHVAMATLMALIAFRVKRWLGWLYSAYAILIFLGSVHLAWHYAIDGYAGALGTLGIWYVSGGLARAWERRTAKSVWFAR